MMQIKGYANMSPSELIKSLEIPGPPYDPYLALKKLNVNVESNFTMEALVNDVSGKISITDDKVNVWVNPGDVSYRRNFTVAHELGHLINDLLPLLNGNPSTKEFIDHHRNGRKNTVERRADDFAAKFLMPADSVIKEVSQRIEQAEDKAITVDELVTDLAQLYNVSQQAMRIRLRVIGIIN